MKKYLLFVLILNSCTANYHLRKFISKGGKIDTTTITTTLHDTLHLKGRDSVITREIQIKCPEPIAPETRYEIRWKYKTKIDSLKTVRYVTKWKTKEVVKVAGKENKREWWLLVVGALIGIVSMLIIRK